MLPYVYITPLSLPSVSFFLQNDDKSVFSFLRQLTTWHCTQLLLRAVLRRGCCWTPSINRSISPARRAHSSKPAAEECGGRMGQTDGQTDIVWLHGPRRILCGKWQILLWGEKKPTSATDSATVGYVYITHSASQLSLSLSSFLSEMMKTPRLIENSLPRAETVRRFFIYFIIRKWQLRKK